MQEISLIHTLNERIKELSCLYDISSLAADHSISLPGTLQAIAERIALAWQYSEEAIAEIRFKEFRYISRDIPGKTVSNFEPIIFDGQHYGSVRIHYPSPSFASSDFLQEEKQLLKKIAQEIAGIVERHERLEKEEWLKRSVEHTDRLAILGEITAGIAHELNTPLGNILGFSQLISGASPDPGIQRDAQKIRDSAIYAREVVKKLMFFSCEMPQQKESIAINPLIEDAVKLLRPSIENAEINVIFEKDPSNPEAHLDPIQITQVLFNMLINSIYASAAGSSIRIKLHTSGQNLHIIIEDEGCGIPEEARGKIFEPFYTTKPVGEGSGLGLSVVHGIVKSHKGSIHFSTEEGMGTTFNISLPLQQP